MAKKIKVYKIFVDGIDKCGKDTIVAYVDQISGHKYAVKSRGVLSQIAYAHLYNRDFEYDLRSEKYALHVLVDVEYDDWLIRCKLTKEPKIDYDANVKAFDYAVDLAKDKIKIIHVNSTENTPYEIAKYIIATAEAMDRGEIKC